MVSMAGNKYHRNYDAYSPEMARRLDGFWGQVDRRINERILRLLPEGSVLDVGCGFGSLTAFLSAAGRDAIGVDMMEEALDAARSRYPGVRVVHHIGAGLPAGVSRRRTIVLKDTLHHLVAEADVDALLTAWRRDGAEYVVVSDPNPNVVLRACRSLIRHTDPECSVERARDVLARGGFDVIACEYDIIFSLPLSGGYVGPVLWPRWRVFGDAALALETALVAATRAVGAAPALCWRYFLVARRRPSAA
jgi:SAM-dependent methyltransferase